MDLERCFAILSSKNYQDNSCLIQEFHIDEFLESNGFSDIDEMSISEKIEKWIELLSFDHYGTRTTIEYRISKLFNDSIDSNVIDVLKFKISDINPIIWCYNDFESYEDHFEIIGFFNDLYIYIDFLVDNSSYFNVMTIAISDDLRKLIHSGLTYKCRMKLLSIDEDTNYD